MIFTKLRYLEWGMGISFELFEFNNREITNNFKKSEYARKFRNNNINEPN